MGTTLALLLFAWAVLGVAWLERRRDVRREEEARAVAAAGGAGGDAGRGAGGGRHRLVAREESA